jgi:hypothetical protein
VYHRCEKKRNLRGWEKRKTKGICGEETQRFEPNLPLSEINLKIVEGGISGISDAQSQVGQSRANIQKVESRLCFYGTCSTSWFKSHFVEMTIQTTIPGNQ